MMSWTDRFAYALPAFALAVIGIPVYVHLPKFYTDTIGMDIAVVGTLLFCVRLFDAVTDPVIGHISDRTRTRWGRRRPLMVVGSLGLAVSLVFLFTPPEGSEPVQILRFGFCLFALFFCWTLVTIPYEALGPELTPDYHERTTLFSLRDGALVMGTLVAAASPMLAAGVLNLLSHPVSQRRIFTTISMIYTPLIIAATGVCVLKVRERNRSTASSFKPVVSGVSGMSTVVHNRPFMILLAAYAVSSLGSNLPATLLLYYVAYVLQTTHAEVFLLLYFATGIILLPLWVWISRKIGKKPAWIWAMLINTGAFFGVFFLEAGQQWLFGVLVVISGAGFGAGLALPSSIQADVIDYDEMMTGRRREGQYIGLWSIVKKLSAALGVGAGLLLLGNAGYVPNQIQSDEVTFLLRVLYALIPCLCNALAIGIIWFYPITENRHQEIRAAINQQRSFR